MAESEGKTKDEDTTDKSPRRIDSSDLFRGDRTLVITHAGEQYRLTITRNDKLILQK